MPLDNPLERGPIRMQDVHQHVHGSHIFGRFNTWLAVRITRAVGSMWAAYLFMLLALVSLPAAIQSGDVIVIVAWTAQTLIQLVLLPVIIVGQNIQAAHSDARAESDHEILSQLFAINQQQLEILSVLHSKDVHDSSA